MATLTTQNLALAGITPTYAAAAGGGDKVVPGAGVFMIVKNGGGSPITVTIATPGTVSGLAIADQAVVVTNAEERMISVPSELYRDPADGLAAITYSGVTTVTIGCFRI